MSEGIGPGQEAEQFESANTKDVATEEQVTPLVMTKIGREEAGISGLTEKQIAALTFVRETVTPGTAVTKEFILLQDGPQRENGRDLPLRWDIYKKTKR